MDQIHIGGFRVPKVAVVNVFPQVSKMIPLDSKLLAQSVELLGLAAEEQLKALTRLGFPENVDELALQFHDQAVIADQLSKIGKITARQLSIVKEIDRTLGEISGPKNAALWTPDALKESTIWEDVRRRAKSFFE
jgi:uncharacterized protein YcaQ